MDIIKYFNENEPINRALEWKREALLILSQTRSNATDTIAIIVAGITRRTPNESFKVRDAGGDCVYAACPLKQHWAVCCVLLVTFVPYNVCTQDVCI